MIQDVPPHQQNLKESTDASTASVEHDLIALPSGEALTSEQAAVVAASAPTKLIVIVGPYGSGKTTILTALFEAFQEAPFGNYTFRGSRTLVGFEKRCHLGRKESGQEKADTSHTSAREGIVFLHLDLAFRDAQQTLSHANILLSDISGELFKRVRDVGEAADHMEPLKRADHVCIVIDGEKIVDKKTRQEARNDSRAILRSIIEAGVLSKSCAIDLAITKWDVIFEALQEGGNAPLQEFIDETVRAVKLAARDRRFNLFQVAARPPKEAKVPFAHGLPSLLRAWMGHGDTEPQKQSLFHLANPDKQIDRYTGVAITKNGLLEHYDVTAI